MSMSTEPEAESSDALSRRDERRRRVRHAVSFGNIGAVYVWIVIIIIFCFWAPNDFPTLATVRQVVNGNTVTALLALALVIPLCARVFDLSVAFVASLSCVTVAYFIAHGTGTVPAIALALGAALSVGFVNAFVVVIMDVDSFIATLATGLLIQSVITLITNDVAINDARIGEGFANVSQSSIDGVTLPVFYVLIVATAIWFLLEHTASGRRLYAVGFNADAARLTGVRTKQLRFVSLLISAVIAGVAGVVLASSVGSGDPTAGNSYLLPAFAGAFLGATQLRGGRFNAWGTLIAVLLIGTGIVGLGLANAPSWAANAFTGVVLIAALAITSKEQRAMGLGGLANRFRGTKAEPPPSDPPPASIP
jgi:ribose/xylose/arabinose/galactoside ABC-type transport system permease subunit